MSIDLAAIGETTYDLPTLDDETRPGVNDSNDPFGGNDGKNQALLVPGGPVQVFAPGFRNPYDLLITSSGQMYTIDNGANAGWGDVPIGEGPGGNATNDPNEPGVTYGDGLHLITGAGYYGGHPNPTRSNPLNTFNPSNPQSPVSVASPIESDFLIPGVENRALHVFGSSTNGLAEYTSGSFNGALLGGLLAASFDNSIQLIKLTPSGAAIDSVQPLFSNVGTVPLDVTAPVNKFFGSIWVADIATGLIYIFEPSDGGNATPDDLDGDGYSNNDEIANGTDPLNGGDVPPDNDLDFISDLLDPDDDNDTIADIGDAFPIDADNGTTTPVGTLYTWENDAPSPGGLLGLGFTGLMNNGVEDYLDLFDASQLTAGGAAGVLTIDSAKPGTALGSSNSQGQAFQFGVNVAGETAPFVARTRLLGPFTGLTPQADQEMGFYIGLGDQDNYVKFVLNGAGGGSLQLLKEVDGVVVEQTTTLLGVTLPGPSSVDLYLSIDPLTQDLQASFSIDQGTRTNFGALTSVPSSWLSASLAVGVLAVDPSDSGMMPVTWDFLGVQPESTPANPAAFAKVDFPSTFGSGSFTIRNDSTNGQQITSYTIDLSTSFMPDVVFDPNGTAGDLDGKTFTPDQGAIATGLLSHQFLDARDGGFNKLQVQFGDFDPGEEFKFSIDIDPTSIQGVSGPGPEDSGSISGFEVSGATVTIDFSDASSFVRQLFRSSFSDVASEAIVNNGPLPLPSILLVGLPDGPNVVADPSQTVRLSGPVGASIRLIRVEGALHLSGVPGGGYDIDPFEINKALVLEEYAAVIGPSGTSDLPVTLTNSNVDGGLNYIFAVLTDSTGETSSLSNVLIAELNPALLRPGIATVAFGESTAPGDMPIANPAIIDALLARQLDALLVNSPLATLSAGWNRNERALTPISRSRNEQDTDAWVSDTESIHTVQETLTDAVHSWRLGR